MLACLDHLVSEVLEHQGVGVAQEAGVGGIARNLVVEEQAPVVAVGHGQLAIGQGQPVEHLFLHSVVVVHQGVGLPFLGSVERVLEEFQGQCGLAQLLDDHVLVGGVEIVVVLQRVVVVEILALVEVGHGGVVVVGVDHRVVIGVVAVAIAVDGKLAQTCEPLGSQLVVGEQAECGGQHIGLPTILLGLRVASVAGGDGASQLVVALGL